MAYNRLLKLDVALLVVVVVSVVISLYAISVGYSRFIGILGIALLALALITWRIFSLTKSTANKQEEIELGFDPDLLAGFRPPLK